MKAKFRCSLAQAWPWLRLEMDITWKLFHPAACISFSDSLTFSLWLLNSVGRHECFSVCVSVDRMLNFCLISICYWTELFFWLTVKRSGLCPLFAGLINKGVSSRSDRDGRLLALLHQQTSKFPGAVREGREKKDFSVSHFNPEPLLCLHMFLCQ